VKPLKELAEWADERDPEAVRRDLADAFKALVTERPRLEPDPRLVAMFGPLAYRDFWNGGEP
jgi:hypothetical protein